MANRNDSVLVHMQGSSLVCTLGVDAYDCRIGSR